MADIQGMMADPAFQALDAATQKQALGRLDPAIGNLSDADYQTFRQRVAKPTPGMEKLGGQPPAAGSPPTPPGALGAKPTPDNFWTSPNGFIRTGARQLGSAALDLAGGRKAEAVSDALEGAGRMITPAALPFAAAAPVAALGAAGAGYLGQKLGEYGARKFGASPETERMIGDVASIPASVAGGAGGGLLSKAAGPLAESALGIRGVTHAYGANPGKAILEETSGVRPSTVERSAKDAIKTLGQEVEARAAASPNKASLLPARNVVESAIGQAAGRNSTATPSELQPLKRFLNEPTPGFAGATEYPPGAHTPISYQQTNSPVLGPNGQPIPGAPRVIGGPAPAEVVAEKQPAAAALGMRRQLDQDFIRNWNPALNTKGMLGTARRAYGAVGSELDKAVPGLQHLDQRISGLIPAAQRARMTDLSAGPGERILNRVSRPTGGMLPLIFGYHEGGPLGALGTLIGQETLSSPAAKMMGARGMYKFGQPLSAAPSAIIGSRRDQQ